MSINVTWKPHTEHGELTSKDKNELPDSVFAFPNHRKEPLTDATHVMNALARFDQVGGVTNADRDQAFANIMAAAKHYGVNVVEENWQQLGHKAHTSNSAQS